MLYESLDINRLYLEVKEIFKDMINFIKKILH
jgi:uncharacterized protein YutE (UPF0331/DUF86 family)